MYKILKDEKIIGISEDVPVLFDEYEVVEDTEHTVDDYEQYQGEYLLKSDIPVEYQNEQIRLQRQTRFTQESDPLKLNYDEAVARGDEEKIEQTKQAWLAKKDQIREELPYITIEETEE